MSSGSPVVIDWDRVTERANRELLRAVERAMGFERKPVFSLAPPDEAFDRRDVRQLFLYLAFEVPGGVHYDWMRAERRREKLARTLPHHQ